MDFVFLGSNATRLSIQLLTDVAQGKGNQVDSEIVSDTHRGCDKKRVKVYSLFRVFRFCCSIEPPV